MNPRALIAEFIGAFALCFAGCGAIVATYTPSGPNHPGGANLIAVALAHGIAIAVMGTSFGAISGGHFNPAVSLAMALSKRLKWVEMAFYWVAQFLGAIAGAFVVSLCMKGFQPEANFGALATNPTITPGIAVILEAIGTFFLVMAIFGTAVQKKAPAMGAWFIGMTIAAMIFAFGPLTGTGINPARWLGPAVVTSSYAEIAVYVAGPLIGAAFAAIVAGFLFKETPEPVIES